MDQKTVEGTGSENKNVGIPKLRTPKLKKPPKTAEEIAAAKARAARRQELKDKRAEKKLADELTAAPKKTVRKEIPSVLASMLKQARGGSCQHAKVLFDYAEVDKMADPDEEQREGTLTELLLKNLGVVVESSNRS